MGTQSDSDSDAVTDVHFHGREHKNLSNRPSKYPVFRSRVAEDIAIDEGSGAASELNYRQARPKLRGNNTERVSGLPLSDRGVTVAKPHLGPRADQVTWVEISQGLQADVPELITLSKRTLRTCYTLFLGQQTVEAWFASALDDFVRERVEGTWLASDDGAIRGYCVVKGSLLDLLLVDVCKHGCGIGTRLLERAEQLMFLNNDEIRLQSFVANVHANTLYSRRGWIESGRHHDAQSDADMLRFSKRAS